MNNEFNISDSLIVGLKQDKLEDGFLELRNHIRSAVEALSKVLPENYNNHQAIFNLIKGGIETGQFYDFVIKKGLLNLSLGTIFSMIKKMTMTGP